MEPVLLYDTTLRDGSQREGISFTVEDKLRITEKLDELGIHYIEGAGPDPIRRTPNISDGFASCPSATPGSPPSA